VVQLFDTAQGVFLADRFVKGECPRCGAPDQYGDNCEKCGATYAATDLKNPVSVLSGTTPEVRSAMHLFVRLEKEHEFLEKWTHGPGHLQPEIANYLRNFFLNSPLRDWDVSRPAPYFGFEIPGHPGQYWYVWFDAPIGYLSSTTDWCERNGRTLDEFWRSKDVEIVHVIGKDIVYFHALFWPAMLKWAGYSLPRRVQVHGFLTVGGEKMSKSRGTQIQARDYLAHLDPAYLRYYYATKLTGSNDDIDLDLVEFPKKVNSDLVGKVVNLASRTARFIQETGLTEHYPDDGGLFANAAAAGEEIAAAYEAFDYARATRSIMALADRANEYVDQKQPWKLAKEPEQAHLLREVCSVCLNLYWQLIVYLAPILPVLAEKSATLLGRPVSSWKDASIHLLGTRIGAFTPLLQRVDPARVEALLALGAQAPEPAKAAPASAEATVSLPTTSPTFTDDDKALEAEPLAETCSIDDFAKVDLRVARVLSAEAVAEARKLLKLTVSLGGSHTRTIFAGIKAAYEPEQLVGRLVVIVANLAPRQMKFGVSEGMVVAAGPGAAEVFVLSPDAGAKPGQRIH
jgi:methionyl-tRNA synthetase